MAGGGVVGSSPGNACTMPNADTRAGFAVTDTLTPISSATLQEGGGVQDSAAATSRCIIINVRTNEADVAVKYDEGRQDMCRLRPSPSAPRWIARPKQTVRKLRQKFNLPGNI